jgi:hypothetical protein
MQQRYHALGLKPTTANIYSNLLLADIPPRTRLVRTTISTGFYLRLIHHPTNENSNREESWFCEYARYLCSPENIQWERFRRLEDNISRLHQTSNAAVR